jgi:hypothetical protein
MVTLPRLRVLGTDVNTVNTVECRASRKITNDPGR